MAEGADRVLNLALVISARDNVATALEALEPGARISLANASLAVVEPIPRGHKLAIRAIPAGADVIKYGSPIGRATTVIEPGCHVHTHNLVSTRGRGDLAVPGPGIDAPGRIAEPDL